MKLWASVVLYLLRSSDLSTESKGAGHSTLALKMIIMISCLWMRAILVLGLLSAGCHFAGWSVGRFRTEL